MTPDTLLPPEDDSEAVAPGPEIDPHDEQAVIDPALFEDTREEPPFARTVLTTPLHLAVAAESRTNRWTTWNGYTTPAILTDLGDEYRALRGGAAMMDISPLVKYRIAGRDARPYLDRLVTRSLDRLEIDRALHVVLCEGSGFVLGDGMLFRLDEDEYRLVTEETHLAWLLDSAAGFRVRIEDVSASLAAISLQGPLAAAILAEAGVVDIADILPSASRWTEIAGMPAYLSRTGANGDLGYEIWIDPDDAPHAWRHLLEHSAARGLVPAGFALRELARLEAGFPRAGKDYLSAFAAIDSADARTPFDLWPEPLIDFEKPLFNGREALRRLVLVESQRRLVPLVVDGLEPVRFAAIHANARQVGTATSIGFSPALAANIALATIDVAALAAPDLTVRAEFREGLSVNEIMLPARVLTEPAWNRPRRLSLPALLQP
ncbi:glycine cleavage T protein (aminomethyl transferase) [Parvibaculum lavamentivorans DS-1]|uniref:Glycine cleavage T protein (Aminomethyl transferase) n=1 Tax=Parvibaculum lavamentivorans (strain DS-1 / DSM 13023 / NCIMB 13966) TaxID=402881 RepID=A7HRN9_PARL1|nr:aminomethyltransferase family protein [Parvibaculum lavamentivorans]ABS62572.1 glycine cleavage T protein (aminomethyl transferase) [Parvibaculum lavamentivorans DS-1]